MIRKYYARSTLAVLLIPVTVVAAGVIFNAIDPESARGNSNYARNFALLHILRGGTQFVALVLACALWFLACLWLVRAKSLNTAWVALVLFGAPGFALLAALADRSPLTPDDAYGRQLARVPQLVRVLYELLRFALFGVLSLQLAEWLDYGTAWLDAMRRGMTLAQVFAERDASSGMWAFGDLMRAAGLFVLLYALWPAACNLVARVFRPRSTRG